MNDLPWYGENTSPERAVRTQDVHSRHAITTATRARLRPSFVDSLVLDHPEVTAALAVTACLP